LPIFAPNHDIFMLKWNRCPCFPIDVSSFGF
jgi:hypothetical protein